MAGKAPETFRCSGCPLITKPKTGKRLPRGWKRSGEDYYCSECWIKTRILRAITFPIVQPMDCTWEELNAELRKMWRETTRCSNWMMTECYARDARRTGDVGEKIPAMPHLYLYPEARKLFPALPSQTVASIEQSVQRKYRKIRYKVVWTGDMSLPAFRYPTPFPVNSQSWAASWIDEQKPGVSVRIGDQRRLLRLKGGAQIGRQKEAFKAIVSGTAQAGEMAIYRRDKELLVKMVAWLPRRKDRTWEPEGTLIVRTDPKSLLVALNGKDEALWTYNGDHLPRWTAEHRKQLQRWSEDQKYENRPVPSFHNIRQHTVDKFHKRMQSACHEIAAQLVGYAERRRFAVLQYNDSEKRFCPDFQWARLRSLIIEKCDASGIRIVIASGDAQPETGEALEPAQVTQE